MNKAEAVREFVARDLSGVPQEWVRIVMENEGEYHVLPMWGTMWICNFPGAEELFEDRTRTLVSEKEDIVLDAIPNDEERERVRKAIETDDWSVLGEYVDEEMAGERNIVREDGTGTSFFIYDVAGEYVIGIHGAGFNFYDKVWPSLYDVVGLKWHDDEPEGCTVPGCLDDAAQDGRCKTHAE